MSVIDLMTEEDRKSMNWSDFYESIGEAAERARLLGLSKGDFVYKAMYAMELALKSAGEEEKELE